MEKKLDSQLIYDGKIIKLYKDSVLCDNGNKATREVVRHNGGVGIDVYKRQVLTPSLNNPITTPLILVGSYSNDDGKSKAIKSGFWLVIDSLSTLAPRERICCNLSSSLNPSSSTFKLDSWAISNVSSNGKP